MAKQEWIKGMGKGNWIKMALVAGIALVLVKIFSPQAPQAPDKPFTVKDCLSSVPADVRGLKIIEGSRSKAAIISDMWPMVCQSKALFEKMIDDGAPMAPGSMLMQVVVEFNGEVISVKIQDSDITHRPFRNRVIDMIAAKDFTFWSREDADAVFLYPIHFGQ